MKKYPRGFTLVEMMIVISIVIALSGISFSLYRSSKERAHQTLVLAKMKSLGTTFAAFTTDRNGDLPYEDSTGSDDWVNAAKPENVDAWYNALPKMMGAMSVGELGMKNPAGFYDTAYPLYMPGAPYPSGEKRLSSPTFAVGMNSRLQRKDAEGAKKPGKFILIREPSKTVVFLERGMAGDKKTMNTQRGFDGSPKANARAFAARHAQKGCLIFADGHAEMLPASSLLTANGGIIFPQTGIVWTLNPEDDPN